MKKESITRKQWVLIAALSLFFIALSIIKPYLGEAVFWAFVIGGAALDILLMVKEGTSKGWG